LKLVDIVEELSRTQLEQLIGLLLETRTASMRPARLRRHRDRLMPR
jgi:hypothetical protein